MFLNRIRISGPGIGPGGVAVELVEGLRASSLYTSITNPCSGLLPDLHNLSSGCIKEGLGHWWNFRVQVLAATK